MSEEKFNPILSSLKSLKTLREKKEQFKTAYEHAMKEFNDLHALLLDNKEKNQTELGACEDYLRGLALEEFKETGEKQITGGMGIRILKKLEYDPVEAFNWALEHKMALQLSKKEFEKLAKINEALQEDFVRITEEPSATIPKEIKVVE